MSSNTIPNYPFVGKKDTDEAANEFVFKILIVGDVGTGKTSLIKRYVHESFSTYYKANIGVDFAIKTITRNGDTLRLQLWDIAGQERFTKMTRVYYNAARAAIIVYDITRSDTFNSVPLCSKESIMYWVPLTINGLITPHICGFSMWVFFTRIRFGFSLSSKMICQKISGMNITYLRRCPLRRAGSFCILIFSNASKSKFKIGGNLNSIVYDTRTFFASGQFALKIPLLCFKTSTNSVRVPNEVLPLPTIVIWVPVFMNLFHYYFLVLNQGNPFRFEERMYFIADTIANENVNPKPEWIDSIFLSLQKIKVFVKNKRKILDRQNLC